MTAILGSSFLIPVFSAPPEARRKLLKLYKTFHGMDEVADAKNPNITQLKLWHPKLEKLSRTEALPLAPLLAMQHALEWDIEGRMANPTKAELEAYCDGVAGSVGELTLHVLGVTNQLAKECAITLGRAVQLTNILRDWREDLPRKRFYFPREWLSDAGIDHYSTYTEAMLHPVLIRTGQWAESLYAQAAIQLDALPQSKIIPARLMHDAYRHHFERLKENVWIWPENQNKHLPLRTQWQLYQQARRYKNTA